MPGVLISVRWPQGWVVLNHDPDGSQVSALSADPNDHYRPLLESLVGRQGWDWDWTMMGTDATLDRLTIKIRHKKAEYATMLALKWA